MHHAARTNFKCACDAKPSVDLGISRHKHGVGQELRKRPKNVHVKACQAIAFGGLQQEFRHASGETPVKLQIGVGGGAEILVGLEF